MQLITPKAELVVSSSNRRHIARIARICYGKSLYYRATLEQDKRLTEQLRERGHLSVFRHATRYYLFSNRDTNPNLHKFIKRNRHNPFVAMSKNKEATALSTNEQFLIEHPDIEKALSRYEVGITDIPPALRDVERLTIAVTASIATTRELNRTSPNNITERSTRYASSGDQPRGGAPRLSHPHWLDKKSEMKNFSLSLLLWLAGLPYRFACKLLPLEDARYFLPLGTTSTAVYTYTRKEWQHILDLRLRGTTGKPHPDAQEIAAQIEQILITQ